MEEVIKYFITKTIPDMNSSVYNLSYIKFVFNDEALDEMSKYNEYEAGKLREIKNNYESGHLDENAIYIKIEDYKMFFYLLKEIVIKYGQRENKGLRNSYNIMRSIWLRMSPSEINDVLLFLKKQLFFLKTDDILPYYKKFFKKYEDLEIYYENKANDDWFETNNNIKFSFVRSGKFDEELPLDFEYNLPSIHYALNKENDEGVCYIYGIQNIGKFKDEIIKEKIKPLKRQLRNKYVSSEFILSLRFFIELLSNNGINTIKVPLLQVFNYQYHEDLSDSLQRAYSSYENKEELEQKYKEGNRDDIVLDYMHDKTNYERFYGKADMISKNKTERLLDTFRVYSEIYGDIEFLNDPFIQGDYLIIKINKQQIKEESQHNM